MPKSVGNKYAYTQVNCNKSYQTIRKKKINFVENLGVTEQTLGSKTGVRKYRKKVIQTYTRFQVYCPVQTCILLVISLTKKMLPSTALSRASTPIQINGPVACNCPQKCYCYIHHQSLSRSQPIQMSSVNIIPKMLLKATRDG